MLVYFEPAAMCTLQEDLILAPLPARKQLWEADNKFVWKAESDRVPPTAFALAASGDLVKLDDSSIHCPHASSNHARLLYTTLDANPTTSSSSNPTKSGRISNWEEWCSGMDGFGGLVMLAASLIE